MNRWVLRVAIGVALFAVVAAGGVGALAFADAEPLPEAVPGPEGDDRAQAMSDAVGVDAWERTGAVQWRFAGTDHLWDRDRSLARVRWGDVSVEMDLTSKAGRAWRGDDEQFGADRDGLIEKAYASWINDGFWMSAQMKAFDQGTSRSAVAVDGAEGVLVQYASGGLTPGDAYLWKLGADGKPAAWKMWVSVLPVPGMDVTCEDWVDIGTGAWVPTTRRFVPWGVAIRIEDVRGARTLAELVPGPDPFAALGADGGNIP